MATYCCDKCGSVETYVNQLVRVGALGRWCDACNRADDYREWLKGGGVFVRQYRKDGK